MSKECLIWQKMHIRDDHKSVSRWGFWEWWMLGRVNFCVLSGLYLGCGVV